MTQEDTLWLAGFVDGEGYIGVVKKAERFQAQVRIGTTHKPTMEYVAGLLGAKLFTFSNAHPDRWKPCHTICVYDKRAEEVMKMLVPYLHTKKEQALNLLAFRKAAIPDRASYHLTSRQLNQRGVQK